MIFRLSTTPGTTSCSRPEYRSSVFSRKMARSSGRSLKAGLQARQHAHRPEIHVEAQLLAQGHVDALVAAGDGRGGGAFEADARGFERGEHVVGNQLAVLGQRAHAGFDALPLDGDAGGFHRAHGGLGHFGSDAVAGDESDRWAIIAIIELGATLIPDWAAERRRMVETQLRRRGIRDERVLARHAGDSARGVRAAGIAVLAYGDEPVHIGYGQTISQPYMTALMAEVLELDGHETVLEVGAGCGLCRRGAGRCWRRA